MVADNDAGGITTYTVSGARYGYNLLWVVVLMFPMVYFIQEMTAAHRRGKPSWGMRSRSSGDSGRFWGWFLMADLAVVNWLTLVTEYIGMTTALAHFARAARPDGGPDSSSADRDGRDRSLLDFREARPAVLPVQLPLHPGGDTGPTGLGDVARSLVHPVFAGGLGASGIMIIVAVVGTTITPWQIFFQQSAVVDKGMQEKDIPFRPLGHAVGFGLHPRGDRDDHDLRGAAFHYRPDPIIITDAAQAAQMVTPVGGRVAGCCLP